MRPQHRQQRDLFDEVRVQREIPAAHRTKLVRLIEGMLSEAIADSGINTNADWEATKDASHE